MEPPPSAIVKALYLYPIKACRGISVDIAFVSSTGFQWDRLWMVVNSQGRMLTQRVEPRLALVEVSLPEDVLHGGSLSADSALEVKAPGMELLRIPLITSKHRRRLENSSIWEWAGSALDEGPDVAEWFTRFIGKPCRLVRFDTDNMTRLTDPGYATGFKVTFSDGYPFLLISEASLDALNEQLPNPLLINRFRPNIFVQGCEPFAEDLWQTFTISNLKFHGVKLCSRCKVTTVDQETGMSGPEPLETLRSFRGGRVMALPKKASAKVFFGQNVVCDESLELHNNEHPMIRAGDVLTVLHAVPSISEAMV